MERGELRRSGGVPGREATRRESDLERYHMLRTSTSMTDPLNPTARATPTSTGTVAGRSASSLKVYLRLDKGVCSAFINFIYNN